MIGNPGGLGTRTESRQRMPGRFAPEADPKDMLMP